MKNPVVAILGVVLILGLIGGALWYIDREPGDEVETTQSERDAVNAEKRENERKEARREKAKVGDDGRVTLTNEDEIRDAATAWVTGRAVEAVTGAPIAGADVSLTGPGAAVEVKSQDDGSFRVAATSLAISWNLRVRSKNLTSNLVSVTGLFADEERDVGDVALKPAGSIQGIVTGPGGSPMVDAKLALFNDTTSGPGGGFDFERIFSTIFNVDDPVEVVRSGADGRFQFPEVPAGSYVVRASQEKHETRFSDTLKVRTGGAAPMIRIQLPPGVSMKGKVVDAQDQPVAGAVVAFLAGAGNSMPSTFRTQKATTDSKGAFEFDTLSLDTYVVLVHKEGLPPSGNERVKPGKQDNIVIKLPEPQKVHGRVTDANTGSPLAEVKVAIFTQENPGLISALTGEDGRYEIPGVPKGDSMMIMVSHPVYHVVKDDGGGMEARMMGGMRASKKEVEEKGGRFDFKMTRGATVKGRVIDRESARGIRGAYVRVSDPQTMMFNFGNSQAKMQTRTDENGLFELKDVAPGDVIALAWHPDYFSSQKISMWGGGRESLVKVQPLDDLTIADIQLDQGHRIEGKIVDTEGNPIAGARVKDLIEAENSMLDLVFSAHDKPIYSGKDGKFAIVGLAPNVKGKLLATHPEYPTGAELEFDVVTELPNQVVLELKPGATVTGVIRKGDGSPVSGGTLTMTVTGAMQIPDGNMLMMFRAGEEGVERTAVTDTKGRFRFDDLPAGKGKIRVDDVALGILGEGQGEVTLEPGGTEKLTLQLEPTVSSSGIIRGPDGKALAKVFVSLSLVNETPGSMRSMRGNRSVRSDEQGRFVFEGLQAGAEYSISAWHQGAAGSSGERVSYSGDAKFRGGDNGVELKMKSFNMGRVLEGLEAPEVEAVREAIEEGQSGN